MRSGIVMTAAAGLLLGCGGGGESGTGPPEPPPPPSQFGTMSGSVQDADSAQAGMGGVSVQVTGASGNQTATTAANGAWTLQNLTAGSYTVSVQAPASRRLAGGESGTRTVSVAANANAAVTAFRLARPRGSIAGSVLAAGAGVSGGSVAAARTGFTARTATPGATGGFTLADVPVGSWTLTLTPPATHEMVAGEAGMRTVTVVEGQAATAGAFQLQVKPPSTGVVTIRMVGTSFEPSSVTIAPGTTVRWVNEGGIHTITPQNAGQPGVWTRVDVSTTGTVLEHTFSTPDQVYRFRCEPHSVDFQNGMVGMITVTG